MPEIVSLSLVVPTLGRATLTACLESVAEGDALPDEILLVDQGPPGETARQAARVHGLPVRVVASSAPGVSAALNEGLAAAAHEHVLITHDDCRVDAAWVATAARLAEAEPTTLLTGRVKPAGDPEAVPSTKDEDEPRDYTGRVLNDVLYPNNALLHRSFALEIGGFDTSLGVAAEDNDFCYRWLRAGHPMRYEPGLVVWHADWRTPEELRRLYVAYGRGQGHFYAKHLRRGDPAMLRFIARDTRTVGRWLAARARGRAGAADWRAGLARGLPRGLAEGLGGRGR